MLRHGAKCDLLNTPGPRAWLVAANVAVFVDDLAGTPFCGLGIFFHRRFDRAGVYSSLVVEYILDARGEFSEASYVGTRGTITRRGCRKRRGCRRLSRLTKGFCSISTAILYRIQACF